MKILKFLWRKWLSIARPIGNFQGQVILSFFYLVILAPLALFLKIFGDPLHIRSGQALRLRFHSDDDSSSERAGQALKRRSSFEKWSHPKETLESARKQY